MEVILQRAAFVASAGLFCVAVLSPLRMCSALSFVILAAALFVTIKRRHFNKPDFSAAVSDVPVCVLSTAIALALGLRYFHNHAFVSYLAGRSDFPLKCAFSMLLTVGCGLFCAVLLKGFSQRTNDCNKSDMHLSLTAVEIAVCVVTAVFCVTLCSQSSPLYPFNIWEDANCFFTVGKSVTNGTVMYRDIYEQKGALLYFLYTLAYLISPNTFFGGYLLELFAASAFLLLSLRSLRLFVGKATVFAVPVTGAVVYSSESMSHGGSAEELMLPLLALCLFIGLRALREKRCPRYREWFAVGAAAAAVLWIKFSVLGFFIGFGLFFAVYYIKGRHFGKIAGSLLSLLGGTALGSAPVLLYFALNGALSDLFTVYFHDNLFMYTVSAAESAAIRLIEALYSGCSVFFVNFPVCVVLMTAGGIYLLSQKHSELMFAVSTAAAMFFFIYCGGRTYDYYSLVFSIYAPIGLLILSEIKLPKRAAELLDNQKISAAACAVLCAACTALAFFLSPNKYLLKYEKDDLRSTNSTSSSQKRTTLRF